MRIRILKRKKEKLRFLLEDSTPAFANALRRIMISEVPVLAIDTVEFEDNTSAMFDETLAHRLGLIPLLYDPKKFNLPGECKCSGKGCSACEVYFALEKTGPAIVLSSDLKPANKNVKPMYPDFPIVVLLKNNHVKLNAIARLGKGEDHAKWQAANVSYQYLPSIEAKGPKNLTNIVKGCPKGVLGIKNRKLVMLDPFECDECLVCEDVSDKEVKIKSDPTKFVFNVESISGLDPQFVVEQSASILQEKGKEFIEDLSKVKG